MLDMGELESREEADDWVRSLEARVTPWQGGLAFDEEYAFDLDPTALGVSLKAGSTGGPQELQLQQRELQFNQAMFQLTRAQIAAPWIDYTSQFAELGRAFGKPGCERWIDKEKRRELLDVQALEQPTGAFAGFGRTAPESSGSPFDGVGRGGGTGMGDAAQRGARQGPAGMQAPAAMPAGAL